MGNQHGGIPADGSNYPQQGRNPPPPRSNVSLPSSRYGDPRVGSAPLATSGTESEWVTPPTSPRRAPPPHSLRAALSPSLLFATALPHVGSTPPPTSTEFESSTDVPLKQSTHVWRQHGTSDPAVVEEEGKNSSTSINGGSTGGGGKRLLESDENRNDSVAPSHQNIRFRNTNSSTEGVDDKTTSRRQQLQQQQQLRKQPKDPTNVTASVSPGCYGSENHSYGNHSSGLVHLYPSSTNHAPGGVMSAFPGISSSRGTDLRLRADRQQEPSSITPCQRPYHTDAADQNQCELRQSANDDVSHRQSESGLLHQSVSPPILLQNPGLNGQTTPGVRHQPFVAEKSSPSQSVVAVQRSMSPPNRFNQSTVATSGPSLGSMPAPINHQTRPSYGQHRSKPPSPISQQSSLSLQRATSPLAGNHPHQSILQQQRPAPSYAEAERTALHPLDDKTSSPWKPSSSSDQSISAAAAASRRPFSPSSEIRPHQPPTSSIAIAGSTTQRMGSERTTGYSQRQEASSSLPDHDQTLNQRFPHIRHSAQAPGKAYDSTVFRDRITSGHEPGSIKVKASAFLHQEPPVNQWNAGHPTRAFSASEESGNQLEGRTSVDRSSSRQSESSERRALGMVREGVASGSMPVFPRMQMGQRDSLQVPLSASVTCSTGRDGGAGRADSLPSNLVDHSRKSSIDSDVSISDSHDGSQHQHLCSSASEISAMEERRRRRAALVRSRTRNNAPPTVSEIPLDTQMTTVESDQISKDASTTETGFKDKDSSSTTHREDGLQFEEDSRQSFAELPVSSNLPSTANVSGFAQQKERTVSHNVSESKSSVAGEKTGSENRWNGADWKRKGDGPATVNIVKREEQKKTLNFSERKHKPQSMTAASLLFSGSHVLRQTVPQKQQRQKDESSDSKTDDRLDSKISERQPTAAFKSKEIIEDTTIVTLVQPQSAGDQRVEDDYETVKQLRPSESLATDMAQLRKLNLKVCAAQSLDTRRTEFQATETIDPLPFHEHAFLSRTQGEILEHFTPTYQAFCLLVNRWITKPPQHLTTERVEYEVEECLCPPSQLQQQAFASPVDDRTFESLTSNLSGQGNVLIHCVASHLASKPVEPKESKSMEILLNKSSKYPIKTQQCIVSSSNKASVTSPVQLKTTGVIVQKKSTWAVKTSGKTSTTNPESPASDPLNPKSLDQTASKQQVLKMQSSSPASAADEKDILECLPLIKTPLQHTNNEEKLTAPILPRSVSSKHEVILSGGICVKSPTSGDVNNVKQSLPGANVTESTEKLEEPVLPVTAEKFSMKQEFVMQVSDEDPVQIQKTSSQPSTMRVIVPGWEKFKAADALGKGDKSAIPMTLPLAQQRLKQEEIITTEKNSKATMTPVKPQLNLIEEQNNQEQLSVTVNTAEQRETIDDEYVIIRKQYKEGQCTTNIGAQTLNPQQQGKISKYDRAPFAKSMTHPMEISTKSSDSRNPATTSSVTSSGTAGAQMLDCRLAFITKTSPAKSTDSQNSQESQQSSRCLQPVNTAIQTSKELSVTKNKVTKLSQAPLPITASVSVATSDTEVKQPTVKSIVSVGPLIQDEVRSRTEATKGNRLGPPCEQLNRPSADPNSEQRGLQKELNVSNQISTSSVKTSWSKETTRMEEAPSNNKESRVSSELRSCKATSMTSDDTLLPRPMLNLPRSGAEEAETPTQLPSQRRPVLQKAKTFDVPDSRPEDNDDDDDEMFHIIVKRGPTKSDEDVSESTNKRISVSERIFKMETKSSGVEGDSPRSSTEISTPVKKQNLFREKSLPGSPLQKKPDADSGSSSSRSSMSEQLQQHLSLIAAAAQKSSADQSIQMTADHLTQIPSKSSKRTTRPATIEEIQKTERVESVSTFRAEVLRQTAINVYKPPADQPDKHLTGVRVKGQEAFPVPFEREKLHDRRKNPRFRATPLATHELYDIPESSPQQQRRGPKSTELRFDPYYKEGSPSQQMRSDAMGQKDQVRTMYSLDEENSSQEGLEEYRQWVAETSEEGAFYESQSNWTIDERTKAETEDELCKLSMAEKRKLFSDKPESSSSQQVLSSVRKKQRRLQSRFKTQSLDEEPITTEEVGKARISPLAMSLVKPPPIEALRALPLKEQREFMAQWAEMTLAQSASSVSSIKPTVEPSSQSASSQAESVEEYTADDKKKGILKPVSETTTRQPASGKIKGILKSNSIQQMKPKGILKTENAPVGAEKKQMHGIMKKESVSSETDGKRKEAQKMEPGLGYLPKKELSLEVKTLRNGAALGQLTTDQSIGACPQQTPTTAGSMDAAETAAEADESSSSASDPTKQNRIKNQAVVRRRQQMQRQSIGRPKTPPNGSSFDSTEPADDEEFVPFPDKRTMTFGRNGRHFTQPITPLEKENMESSISRSDNDDVKASPSYVRLHQRVMALQKSGETGWKQRLECNRDSSSPEDATVVLRDNRGKEECEPGRPRPTSIADRLSLLHSAKETWREKVEEKDTNLFTVEGKMSRQGVSIDSPLQQRPRKPAKLPITRAVSTPNLSMSPDDLLDDEKGNTEADDGTAASTVPIPIIDNDAVVRFFSSSTSTASRLNISLADLDNLSRKTRTLRISVKSVKPNRTRLSCGNPMRTMLEHPGLSQTYYTEVRTGVAERELKRIKHEQMLGTTHFAQEALAGLASKENFSNVTLRKAESSTGSSDKHQPFSEVMLLHVKGRRYCQTRLIEPRASSVNSGDCFILVTLENVFLWVGQYCNIIEKAKATDVANQILQKRDLGIRSSCRLITIPEEYQEAFVETSHFWRTLNASDPSNSSAQPPGGYSEDELYEVYISETNAVYRIKDQRLTPVEEFHGKVLKFEMLRSKEAYVFDFGAEMYVWTGKHVPFDKRKKILQLALELWNKGYNYSEFDINPFAPLALEENGGPPSLGNERPKWALFGKINQNMETVLFREKFVDWPDSSRLIQVKGQAETSKESKAETGIDLKPFDAKLMVPIDTSPVSLVLEGSHLGRGSHWEGFEKGIRREVDILTQGIDIWHVMEFDHYLLDESSLGQLHDGDTYVIRWHYIIAQTGSRTLRADDPRSVLGGRVRCAYFFWQGRHSSINEKGASALMTVELDEERGPQIRVVQGKESPCFLSLFRGRMIVHIGKREDESTNTDGQWRFYMVRNELPNEAYLLEIPLEAAQLRSRGSFLLLNVNTGLLFLWHGDKTTNQTVLRAREIALNLRERCPAEVGLCTDDPIMPFEMIEGSEHAEFWNALQNAESGIYDTLVQDPRPYSFTPRLFHLTSISGAFEATEIVNPARNSINVVTPFPVLQSDMYNASQPALFMLDNHHEVYLWQGWWSSEAEEEADNVRTASAEARFLTNRRCAMQTVLQYCREIDPSNPLPAYIVYAGLEPVVFTNIFPVWETCEAITKAMLNDGKVGDDLELVEDALAKLTDVMYSWDELQRRPLPDGVDPLKLETYLSQEEFEEVVGMSEEDFNALPGWKQVNIKKEVGLY